MSERGRERLEERVGNLQESGYLGKNKTDGKVARRGVISRLPSFGEGVKGKSLPFLFVSPDMRLR
ncbi:MAG: hypothetical protein D6713_05315 [Deltaproteobacteria bacterium]|nr:MAG: hypothetical protein D6713_05315 [Deltaproteobacteria bacterium]